MRFIKMIYKNNEQIPREYNENNVPYLAFPLLESLPFIKHLFTTKEGGVSKGDFATMNISFTRGDDKDAVQENYRRIATIFDVSPENMVVSHQTHTTNVKRVTKADSGKGIVFDRDYEDVDGLITNEKNLVLCTMYADCVPLYFVDVKNKAIGLSHSGWKGTAGQMGKKTLERMAEEFGTKPEDVYAAIGPSICMDCYEVSSDVIEAFSRVFTKKEMALICYRKENGKYQLDLWKANEIILLNAGVLKEHIEVTRLCTHCNSDRMFSHRKTGDKRGNLGAFLCLK